MRAICTSNDLKLQNIPLSCNRRSRSGSLSLDMRAQRGSLVARARSLTWPSPRGVTPVSSRGHSLSTETIIEHEREPQRTKWRNQSRVADVARRGEGPEATGQTCRTHRERMKEGDKERDTRRKREREGGRRERERRDEREKESESERASKRKGSSVTVARNKVKLTS